MPFPFEQLFASSKLRIVSIPDLEPRTPLRIVGCSPVLRDNAFEVQFTSFVEQGCSSSFYVLGVKNG